MKIGKSFRNLFKSNSGSTALIVLGVFLFSALVGYLAPVQVLELKTRDMLFGVRGAESVEHSDIVIVEISQTADEEIPYRYPWPRYVYAKLIENLNRAGVKAIGIDVVFDQPDRLDTRNDSLFAEAMSEYENVILAGHISRFIRARGDGVISEETNLVMPDRALREANPNRSGLVTMVKDPDEYIRRYLLRDRAMGTDYYSLALEMIRILSGTDESEIRAEGDNLFFGGYEIPLFRDNTMVLNYYGGGRTFKYLSFEEIIDDEDFDTVTEMEAFEMNLFDDPEYGILHQGILEDKIVLVGATMPELQDIHPVPVRGDQGRMAMPGVEIHANALQAILDGRYMSHIPGWAHLLVLLIFSAVTVWLIRMVSFWPGLAAMIGILGIWVVLSVHLFLSHQFILFYISPALAIVAGYGSVTAYRYFLEEREKKRIKNMFSSYVSPKLVEQMVDSDDAFRLGGEEKEITALFSDIANFSTLSEQLEPKRLIELMNEYLEEMTRIIMEESGTLDKYIGDAVMAFYGAPMDLEDHAYRACRSAVQMQKSLQGLRDRWREEDANLPEGILNLKVRVGINTGKMVVGNMGSSQRFNYTILGDHVNVAARCESASKKYGVHTIITEDTLKSADPDRNRFLVRFLDNIRVKGRREPVRIYELIGYRDEAGPEKIGVVDQFGEATDLFYRQEWTLAKEKFTETEKLEHRISGVRSDSVTPSRLYIIRCEVLEEEPPGEEWDGVFDQTAKI